MTNPWVGMSADTKEQIATIMSPEEMAFYEKQGFLRDTDRADIQELTTAQLPDPTVSEYRRKIDEFKNNSKPTKVVQTGPAQAPTPSARSVWDGVSKNTSNNNSKYPTSATEYRGPNKDVTGNDQEERLISEKDLTQFEGITNMESINPDDFKLKANTEMDIHYVSPEGRAEYWEVINSSPQLDNETKYNILRNQLEIEAQRRKGYLVPTIEGKAPTMIIEGD